MGSLFNKVAGLQCATLLKKKLRHWWFSVNSAKFLRSPYIQKTSRRLLLLCLRILFKTFCLCFCVQIGGRKWVVVLCTNRSLPEVSFFSCFGFQTRSIRSIKVGIVKKPDPNYGPEKNMVPLKRNRSKNGTSRR